MPRQATKDCIFHYISFKPNMQMGTTCLMSICHKWKRRRKIQSSKFKNAICKAKTVVIL